MIVNILLLDGAVKAFGMGIHLSAFLWGVSGRYASGSGDVHGAVHPCLCVARRREVLHKLRAVVGQDVLEREGEEEYGIQGDAMARVSSHELLWFSALLGSFLYPLHPWCTVDESSCPA